MKNAILFVPRIISIEDSYSSFFMRELKSTVTIGLPIMPFGDRAFNIYMIKSFELLYFPCSYMAAFADATTDTQRSRNTLLLATDWRGQ